MSLLLRCNLVNLGWKMDGNEIAKDDLDDEEIPQPQTNKETTLSFLVVSS